MKIPGVNLSELYRRLGVQRMAADPELVEVVFPVALVADGTELVPPLRPPASFQGARIQNGAGNLPAFSVQTLSPGGCWVHDLIVEATNACSFFLYAGDWSPFEPPVGNPPLNSFTVPIKNVVGSRAADSELRVGDVIGASFAALGSPMFTLGNGARIIFPHSFYLQPGFILQGEFDTGGALPKVSCVIEDIPATPVRVG